MDNRLLRPSFSVTTSDDLQQIIAHIMQDSAEKAEEILVQADEEFKNERVREILQGFSRIDKEYETKEIKTRRESLVYESKMKNLSRLKILQTKYEHVEDVLEKGKLRLSNKDMSTHTTPYTEILKALIIQGLCKLMEPKVVVTVRKSDMALARSLLGEVKDHYEQGTGLPLDLQLCAGKYLNPASEGGLLLSSPDYNVTLDNTLSSRLDMIGFYILPEINALLFGLKKPEVPVRRPSYLPDIADFGEKTVHLKLKEDISLTALSIKSIDEVSAGDICKKNA